MPDNPLGILGYMAGQLHTNQQGGLLGNAGQARPFGPGEYLNNPNGSWSNEMAYTVAHPDLNNGMPTNIPGLWIKDGKPYHANEDEAAQFAAQSGLQWPTYQRLPEAEAASMEREKNWQSISPQQSGSQRPLYVLPQLPLGRR